MKWWTGLMNFNPEEIISLICGHLRFHFWFHSSRMFWRKEGWNGINQEMKSANWTANSNVTEWLDGGFNQINLHFNQTSIKSRLNSAFSLIYWICWNWNQINWLAGHSSIRIAAFSLVNSFLELISRSIPEINEWIKLNLAAWINHNFIRFHFIQPSFNCLLLL